MNPDQCEEDYISKKEKRKIEGAPGVVGLDGRCFRRSRNRHQLGTVPIYKVRCLEDFEETSLCTLELRPS